MIGPPPLNCWKRNSVTSVLKNPRIAGWSVYRGAHKVEGERAELTAGEVRGE